MSESEKHTKHVRAPVPKPADDEDTPEPKPAQGEHVHHSGGAKVVPLKRHSRFAQERTDEQRRVAQERTRREEEAKKAQADVEARQKNEGR